MTSTDKIPNKLINEKSPYLLQHAYNPVSWYPWSDEVFTKAKNDNKPIFLSIGYSTCHWCHVMERESFEDIEVASILNDNFYSIKVDREERPDIDNIYMNVCQLLNGSGGWPLTIIMTPDKKPFFAGTYYPKHSNYGRPGLIDILTYISENWKNNSTKLIESSDYIIESINAQSFVQHKEPISDNISDIAFDILFDSFDNVFGGFGNAPKFPTPHTLYFLMRYYNRTNNRDALYIVEKTLEQMYRGGIYDHIGYGFCRYSTDGKWLVPHFEKMLYDNALLSIAYIEAYQLTNNDFYKKVATEIFTYILRDMTSPDGGFYSAQDADSEDIEGKFYTWDYDEIIKVLGENDGKNFCNQFNITHSGNFEGKNIPNLIKSQNLNFDEEVRKKLFNYRESRIHPYKDDKVLTSWNALIIAALSIGARVFNDNTYTLCAEKAINFIYSKLFDNTGRLLTRYRDGESSFYAYADDYSFLIWSLIELYQATYNIDYLEKAINLNHDLIKLFWDNSNGGLYLYGIDGEQLLTRPKEIYDGAIPSANSVATLNWLRLSKLTGNPYYEELVTKQFEFFGNMINQSPTSYTYMLCALEFANSISKEIVIVGDYNSENTKSMINTINKNFNPNTASLLKTMYSDSLNSIAPFTANLHQINGDTTAYVCKNFACYSPITNINELENLILE